MAEIGSGKKGSATHSMKKTQILITDIPKNKFSEEWPKWLEKQLFEDKFPELKINLQYFTPLSFLNRIVIIMDTEASTITIYEYLKDVIARDSVKMKLYMTESLLISNVNGSDKNPIRSRSFDDVNKYTNNNNNGQEIKLDPIKDLTSLRKPILSLDTNPQTTGVSLNSLSVGGQSLSPDRASLESPTLLKFSGDSKSIYYQEPLPKVSLPEGAPNTLRTATTCLFEPGRDTTSLTVDTGRDNVTNSDSANNTPPKSPTITLNQFIE